MKGRKVINLVGERFGKLTVLKENGRNRCEKVLWQCKCDCGEFKTIVGTDLKRGNVRSCGCIRNEQSSINMKQANNKNKKHGHSILKKSTEYEIWSSMKQRCLNPKSRAYRYYGARGITVCNEWKVSFPRFLQDMGSRPSLHYSLDRLDVDGDYCLSNCKWSTIKEQQSNRRTSSNEYRKGYILGFVTGYFIKNKKNKEGEYNGD